MPRNTFGKASSLCTHEVPPRHGCHAGGDPDAQPNKGALDWCREFGLERAQDEGLVEFARENGMVVVTVDKRFGDIVMLSGWQEPSVVILRLGSATFDEMVCALERVLTTFPEDELRHAIISVESDKLRRPVLA